jgi:hypothetical protein
MIPDIEDILRHRHICVVIVVFLWKEERYEAIALHSLLETIANDSRVAA